MQGRTVKTNKGCLHEEINNRSDEYFGSKALAMQRKDKVNRRERIKVNWNKDNSNS